MSEWIKRRLKAQLESQDERKQRLIWEERATASYPARFEELKQQLVADVEQYNEAFDRLNPCWATLKVEPNEVTISTNRGAVTVSRAQGNVIQLLYIEGRKETPDCLEVTADSAGRIGYQYRGRILADQEDASELILDRILC